MSTKELQQELAALVNAAEEALSKATSFADEHKLSFSYSPAYGMGGYYNSNPEDRWQELGWNPSSQSC